MVGLVASLALWVAMETMLYVGVVIVTLGLRWVLGLQGMEGLVSFLAGLTAGTTSAIVLENGASNIGSVVLDELSIVFVLFFGLAAILAHLLARAERLGTAPRPGMFAGGGGAATIVLTMLVVFPEIVGGPLGEVDPFYNQVRLQEIAEIQPVSAATFSCPLPASAFGSGFFRSARSSVSFRQRSGEDFARMPNGSSCLLARSCLYLSHLRRPAGPPRRQYSLLCRLRSELKPS